MPILGDAFVSFRERIQGLPTSGRIRDDQMLNDEFLLERDGAIEIFYAPVDWLRPHARLAIVGITPSKETMRFGASDRIGGDAGSPDEEVLRKVKAPQRLQGSARRMADLARSCGASRGRG